MPGPFRRWIHGIARRSAANAIRNICHDAIDAGPTRTQIDAELRKLDISDVEWETHLQVKKAVSGPDQLAAWLQLAIQVLTVVLQIISAFAAKESHEQPG